MGLLPKCEGLIQKYGADKLSAVDKAYYSDILKMRRVLEMGNHAILSASSSHRWLNCLPSARLELEFEDQSGEAAKEGTAAHDLCEHKLKKALHMRSRATYL